MKTRLAWAAAGMTSKRILSIHNDLKDIKQPPVRP